VGRVGVTRRAALTSPPAGDPFATVAGLSVLLRQLLSLQDAGITEVELDVDEGTRLALLRDPRVRLNLVAKPGRHGGTEATLTAPLGVVWHRALPARLVKEGYEGDLTKAPLRRGEFVIPAANPAARRDAEDRLLASLIKPTDGIISRAINRKISLRVTRALLDTSLTPNQMTWIAAVFGALAIGVVAWGGARMLVPGALLLWVQSILDGCDGEISRLKYIRSRLGEWLDQVGDDLVNVGYFAVVGWTVWRTGSTLALWLTVVGTVLHVVYQVSLYTALITRGGGSGSVTSIRWWGQKDFTPESTRASRGLLSYLKEGVEMAGRRDFFTFLYLPAALLGMNEVALAWSAIIFAVSGLTTGLQWILKGGPEPAARTS
jgi:phosphatidylglycerophosphate synthase